jgi:hypothetical protein
MTDPFLFILGNKLLLPLQHSRKIILYNDFIVALIIIAISIFDAAKLIFLLILYWNDKYLYMKKIYAFIYLKNHNVEISCKQFNFLLK